MERLRKKAEYYAALMNPQHPYWTDFPPEVRDHLEALILFKVSQFRPVAISAMEQWDPDNVFKLLRMLSIVSFRYTVISSLGTGNLEKSYSDAALALHYQRATKIKDVYNYLKHVYVNDDRFVADFAQKDFTNARITRYILAEINDHLEKDPEHRVADESGRVTVEHILPKNPSKDWKGAIPAGDEFTNYVDLIGNLSLLEKGKNRGLANAAFIDKRDKGFKTSKLALNRYFDKKTSWTHVDIQERCANLAKTAKVVWRLDY